MNDTIELLPVSSVMEFPNHPFCIREDEQMYELISSIKQFGILTPVIVRKTDDGKFHMVSGHRRLRACHILGIAKIPAVIKETDIDTATVMMVDSNLQRENILPSEKARAYKMKLDALKKQGFRTDLAYGHIVQKSDRKTTRDKIAETAPDSSAQIRRLIRLNNLIPQFLDLVDCKKIALLPAVELSYLKTHEQLWVLETVESELATPSLSQALRMKKLSSEGGLTEDAMLAIMTERKKPDRWNLVLPMNSLSKYFPANCPPEVMQKVIYRLLDRWSTASRKK